jgi:hypothetical protein
MIVSMAVPPIPRVSSIRGFVIQFCHSVTISCVLYRTLLGELREYKSVLDAFTKVQETTIGF